MTTVKITPVSRSIPFDNSTNGFIATDVQSAIEEILTSASPGFDWTRSGSISSGSVLLNGSVPSNISGRWVYINSATVNEVFISNQDINTFDVNFFYHDGNDIGRTSIGSVSIVAARGGRFTVSWSVPTNKQLGCEISSGSAKNIVVGAELHGTA